MCVLFCFTSKGSKILRPLGNFYFILPLTNLLWDSCPYPAMTRATRWSHANLTSVALCILSAIICHHAFITVLPTTHPCLLLHGYMPHPQKAYLAGPSYFPTSSSFPFLSLLFPHESVLCEFLVCWWWTHWLGLFLLNLSVKKMLNYTILNRIHVQNSGKQWNCGKIVSGNFLVGYN